MRPADLIPSSVRDRLDAARDHMHVSIDWVEPGSPRSYGRAFGFWVVRAGPLGWERRPPDNRRYGEPRAEIEEGPFIVEWPDLPATINTVLDYAEGRWPP